jgi:hypothetical protein
MSSRDSRSSSQKQRATARQGDGAYFRYGTDNIDGSATNAAMFRPGGGGR